MSDSAFVRATPREDNPHHDPSLAFHSDRQLCVLKAGASPAVAQRIDFELAHRRLRRRAELGPV